VLLTMASSALRVRGQGGYEVPQRDADGNVLCFNGAQPCLQMTEPAAARVITATLHRLGPDIAPVGMLYH
jgi:hypothetical protein